MGRFSKALLCRMVHRNERRILLVGQKLLVACIASDLLSMGIEIDSICTFSQIVNGEFNIIGRGGINELFIIYASNTGHKEVYEFLTSLGFVYNRDFVLMNIGGYTKSIDLIDPLLTYSRKEDNFDGFKQYGNINDADDLLIIIGNSTSDSYTAGLVSWPEMLYSKLCEINPSICVLNGSMAGYNTSMELLKIIRDVLPLRPKYLIMLEGYNDRPDSVCLKGHPFSNRFQKRCYDHILGADKPFPDSLDMRNLKEVTYGVYDKRISTEVLMDNLRIIKAISDEFSICFIPIIQPLLFYGNPIIEDELLDLVKEAWGDQFGDNRIGIETYARQLDRYIHDYPFVHSFLHLFDGLDFCYQDTCHYTEKGNEIISSKIMDIIVGKHSKIER